MPSIRRIVFVLLLDAVILLLLSELLDGFVLDGARTALAAAALIGLLNSLVWPIFVRFALPITVLTLGLGALLLNGLLVTVAIDLSGRFHLVFDAPTPASKIGDFDTELLEDFWQGVASNALFNLHMLLHHGRNSHHIAEALFKGAARALRMAVEIDPRNSGIPSTKGTL